MLPSFKMKTREAEKENGREREERREKEREGGRDGKEEGREIREILVWHLRNFLH